ncbi:hypothetical protein [Methanolobus sp.]|uniref:hypothetical protein n=1 Tax=Methanolobus sp. TaxID=1874737 RepID=UPI0025EA4D41|nr:hypothetical protein [Methanolobus sp.]
MVSNNKPKLKQMWIIRGSIGEKGLQENAFLNEGVVAIGWNRYGDLSRFKGNKLALKEYMRAINPEYDERTIGQDAGTISRFIDSVGIGDFVVLPQHEEPFVHLGRITSEYMFLTDGIDYEGNLDEGTTLKNIRKVKWIKKIPRDRIEPSLYKYLNVKHTLYSVNEDLNRHIQKLSHAEIKQLIEN